ARVFEGLPGAAAGPVGTGWIAVMLREKRMHRFPYGREKGCGCVVVEIDRSHRQEQNQKSGSAGRRGRSYRSFIVLCSCCRTGAWGAPRDFLTLGRFLAELLAAPEIVDRQDGQETNKNPPISRQHRRYSPR